jgi:1,2-dihydroxy-3-keto-5-methylthiopentene dioxygenase
MAVVLIPHENRRLADGDAIREFLAPFAITHQRWPLEERVDPNAAPEAILAAYAPEIEALKSQGGYVTADVIDVGPETPNLDALLEKFRKEHTHSEDEVRFILKGRGLFHVRPPAGPVFAIQVEAGDLLNVPKDTKHWFDLCADKTIRAIRLFQDKAGWTPHYIADATHARYTPVCWSPQHVAAQAPVAAAVRV